MKQVAIVAFEGSVEMSITIPRDMFCAARIAQHKRDGSAADHHEKFVYVATQDGNPVTTFSGSRFQPDG